MMRPDMHEVVIERPRGGWRGRIAPPPFRWRHDDDERVARVWKSAGSRTKWLSDLLGPLQRFLRRSAGRPWDDVYGELRAGISPRSALHLHILEHVAHLVKLPHELDPADPSRTRDGRLIRGGHVCPATGLLRWVERSHRHVRDADGWVRVHTFLTRRVGRRWSEVRADAVRLAPRPSDVPWSLRNPDGPGLGAFAVEDGVLRGVPKGRR